MNPNGPYKRKIYFINKEFQGRMIFNYFVLLALGSLVFVAIFSFFSSNTLSIVYDDYRLQLGTTPGILFKEILSTQWIFIVVGGLLVCYITLRLTHRVAGPFFRFEKSLDDMIKGDISRKIVLRDKDEGKVLAQKINTFNERLSENLVLIEDMCAEIAVSVRKLEAEAGEANHREAASLVHEIKQSQRQIETTINEYTFNIDPRL